jgi:hypothetical protein
MVGIKINWVWSICAYLIFSAALATVFHFQFLVFLACGLPILTTPGWFFQKGRKGSSVIYGYLFGYITAGIVGFSFLGVA